MALEDQMEMNFGIRGVDPISGNEVPTGSLPEEVRDDIPAQLSEGEYVVPADVVRYYGVKFFEDLRMQAKMGFDEMAANGRIGGDPIEDELELSMDDIEVVQAMDDGGVAKKKEPKFRNRYEKIMYYLSQLLKEKEEEEKKLKGKSIAEQINFGGKYDEGGDVFYDQKGGFDMSEAGTVPTGVATTSAFEARTYMNAEGHKIVIMFLNGEPITPIPDGYFPVGDTVTTTPDSQPEASSGGGGGGGSAAPAPTPINYKELSLEELRDMVNGQKSMASKMIGATVIGKIAMWDQTRRTKAEIERRLNDPATTEVDKMRLNNLLEIANREEPGLIKTILDKVTGKELERIVGQIPKPVTPDVDYSDPTLAPDQGIYTPEVTQSDAGSVPVVTDPESNVYDPIPPVSSGFGGMGPDPAETLAKSQTRFEPKPPEVRGDTRKDKDSQRRRNRQQTNKNLQGKSTKRKTGEAKSATRGLGSSEKKGGAELDSRFGISGLNKGGLMKNKKKKSK